MKGNFQTYPTEELYQKLRNPSTGYEDRRLIIEILHKRGKSLQVDEFERPFLDKKTLGIIESTIDNLLKRGNSVFRDEVRTLMKGKRVKDLTFDEAQYLLQIRTRLKYA